MTHRTRHLRPVRIAVAVVIPVAAFLLYTNFTRRPQLEAITLPPGFSIAFYSRNVPNARAMALGSEGTVFVGSRRAGNVYAVVDRDGDNLAEAAYTIAENLRMPSGVAFRDGSLYVAAVNRILRYDNIESRLADPPQPVVIRDDLPTETHHGWKFIGFGPDGLLYVPVGAPCNVCRQSDERFASILRMRPDGSNLEVFARGIRNSVGFDWDPETGELWFTDNGRDMLGDDRPPDELNHAARPGMHFGFPYCHGRSIPDPEYGAERSCDEFTPPARRLGPHVAAIGMRFYTGTMFPDEYRGQVFIAEHGSWNRSSKIGYRVTRVRIEDNLAVSYDAFAEGWLREENAWGRPADIMGMPDGALLVSDDRLGVLYRISYAQ
jgi:glucose/arabinose dehydrogenase